MKKELTFYFAIISFATTTLSFSQNHYFGIKAGYTKSMPASPDNQVNFSENNIEISQGVNRFKGLDGFQIGIYSHIDFGYDFIHLVTGFIKIMLFILN